MFQTKFGEKFKTHILCSVPTPKKVPLMRQCEKNIVNPDRSQMTVWLVHIVCWITKAANTHSEYVILIAFPLQQ